MRMLISSPPSPTATISCCPQCAATMRIKLIEPDLKDPRKTRHVFECPECGLPRTYFNYLRKATQPGPPRRSVPRLLVINSAYNFGLLGTTTSRPRYRARSSGEVEQ